MQVGKDTYSYKGWLNCNSFLKRAFSILGYMICAQAIFITGIGLLILLLSIIVGLFGLLF